MTSWTPRKRLIVETCGKLHRERIEKVLRGGRFVFSAESKRYAHELLEDTISNHRRAGLTETVSYYQSISDLALERLITDTLKEKR